MAETKIYLIRHGEIDNPTDVYYGRLPGFPMSPNGIEQVKHLAKIFQSRGVHLDVVYASPMERAQQTAQLVSESFGNIGIETNENLSDTYIPSLEGKPLSILRVKGFRNEYGVEFRTSDSETAKDVIERAKKFLDDVKQKHLGESIALVSHGDPIRFILWEFQYPEKELDVAKIKDEDYPELAEAIELRFGPEGQFLGFEHIRREKTSLKEDDSGNRLKEA